MMPKIGDVVNDWMLIARRSGKHYKYIWKCKACGDTITKYYGAPPLHRCHRKFAPQTSEDKEIVNCWYQSDFDLIDTAIKSHHDYEYCRVHLAACEIDPWPNVSPDVHYTEDNYDEVEADG